MWLLFSLSAQLLVDLQGELVPEYPTMRASLLPGQSQKCERSLATRSERRYGHSKTNFHFGSAFALEPNFPRSAVGHPLLAYDQ